MARLPAETSTRNPELAQREEAYPWLGSVLDLTCTPRRKKEIRRILSIAGGNAAKEAVQLRKWHKSAVIDVIDAQPADDLAKQLHTMYGIHYHQGDWLEIITTEGVRLLPEADLIVCRHPPIEKMEFIVGIANGQAKRGVLAEEANFEFMTQLTGLAYTVNSTEDRIQQQLVITSWHRIPNDLIRQSLDREHIPYKRDMFNGGRKSTISLGGIPLNIQMDRFILNISS